MDDVAVGLGKSFGHCRALLAAYHYVWKRLPKRQTAYRHHSIRQIAKWRYWAAGIFSQRERRANHDSIEGI